MSLNGLDDPKVKEAHDTAVAEPGGWFLLKYVSRDDVELMGRGNGGIVEIRNAIAQVEEPAPLFGFLRYRRRNVLIKYVPDECSRLVQARVTVHFTAVTERFSPHDTVFPIATAKDLRDTTLSAACSLHTASGSISSSTSSLRRRRLMEITEDEEEDSRAAKRQSTVPEERPPTAKASSISGEPTSLSLSPSRAALPTSLTATTTSFHQKLSDFDTSPPPPREPPISEDRAHSPVRGDAESRNSISSSRPDLYNTTSYTSTGRPKVKLGPRPSLDVVGRPHTSGSADAYRPVSTLPVGLKIFSKGSKKGEKDRPHSHYPSESPSTMISTPLPEGALAPPPNASVRPHTSGGRPATSSGSSIRPLASPGFNKSPGGPFITPEKARLMKALELRKKQKEKQLSAAADIASQDSHDGLMIPPPTADRTSAGVPKEVQQALLMLDDMAKVDNSGIAFDTTSALKTDESDATRSDSYPVSPIGPSEGDESTRASSVSGSTDETVQEAQTSKPISTPEPGPGEVNSNPENESSTKPPVVAGALVDPPLDPEVPHNFEPTSAAAEPQEAQESPAEPNAEVENMQVSADHVIKHRENETDNELAASQALDDNTPDSGGPGIVPAEKSSDETATATDNPPSSPESPSKRKEWKVPRSKFSVQDLRAAAAAPDIPSEPLPSTPNNDQLAPPPKSPVGSTFSIESKRSHSEDAQEGGASSSKRSKRKTAVVEPIRTDLDVNNRSRANSEANFSSDDDLMDELQSAVVQEAKPVQVSKSPISPVFPSPKKRNTEAIVISRTSPKSTEKENAEKSLLGLPKGGSQPAPPTGRSVSAGAAYLNRINQQQAKPIAKKVNLGSGISQRIKALERLSSLPPGAEAIAGLTAGPPAGTSPAFFAVKKGSVRRNSRSPSIADRANSINRNTPSPAPSRESSPETEKLRQRAGSIQSRVDAFKGGPISLVQPARSRPESISVTARIVRDPNHPYPPRSEAGKDPSDYAPLDLKESPLVIDHQPAIMDQPRETLLERRQSRERRLSSASKSDMKERRSSITVIKDLISDTRTSFSERRRSITLEPGLASLRQKSPSRPPSTHASPGRHRPMSINSRMSSSSRERPDAMSPPPTAGSLSSSSEKGDKKSNRASRMMRRMSNSLSASRKNIAHAMSPTVREEIEPVVDNQSVSSSGPSAVSISVSVSLDIGDVNVQFPDTLLWKRRTALLDSQGFLILSPALTAHGNGKDKPNSGATRRFHLNEFRTVSIPDPDMEELPNSILLDLIEGGELQISCEDRAGQKRVLQALQEAHHHWAAAGQ